MAAIVSSTKPDSFSVSVWMATWMSYLSATSRQTIDGGRGGRPSLRAASARSAPARTWSIRAFRQAAVSLAEEAPVDRKPFGGLEHALMFQGPGVQVVAQVPVAEPVPPPIIVVIPEAMADFHLLRTDEVDVRVDPPAVQIIPSPEIDLGSRADRRDGDRRRAGSADCRPCRCRRSGRRECRCRP